jgi:hypothetical protein
MAALVEVTLRRPNMPLGCESDMQRCRDAISPAAEVQWGAAVVLAENAPGAPPVPGALLARETARGAPAGQKLASIWPHPNMPLQRTRSRALLGRSPLNGGSLGRT